MNGSTNYGRILKKALHANNAYLLLDAVITHLDGFALQGKQSLIECLKMITRVQLVQAEKDDPHGIFSAALIRKNSHFYICFNRDFLMKCIRTCDDLSHLVLHELGHRLRGDLRRSINSQGRVPWKLVNLVADMLNDAALRRYVFHEPPGYLRILYDKRSIYQLLAPPEVLLNRSFADIEGMGAARARRLVEERFRRGERFIRKFGSELAELYCNAWLGQPSFEAIYNPLLSIFSRNPFLEAALEGGFFLGEHSYDYYVYNYWDKWFFSKKFSQYFREAAGFSSTLRETQIDHLLHDRKSKEIIESIRKAVEKAGTDEHPGKRVLPDVGIVPFIGRKEAFLLSGGYQPVFYRSPVLQDAEEDSKLNLYIDVSYSVRECLAFIFGLLVNLKDEISDPVYLFSNRVVPMSIKEIKKGLVRTTGGTDFDCVAEHALNHHFRKILIVSDGYADFRLFREEMERNCEIFAVLTHDRPNLLTDIAGGPDKEGERWWTLKKREKRALE